MKTCVQVLLFVSVSLIAVTPAASQVIGKIVAPDGGWDYASFDPQGRRVLISSGDSVVAVDTASRKASKAASGSKTHAAIALPNREILITNEGTESVTLVNGRTGAVNATIRVGKEPDAALFDPKSGMAYVVNHGSGDISVIDVKGRKEAVRIQVGGDLESAAVDGKGTLFVNAEDRNDIAVVDLAAKKVKVRYKLNRCEGPGGLAYVSASHLLVATCANSHAKAVSALDGKEVADIPIGEHTDAILYDARRGVVYAPSAGSLKENGNITVIAVSSGHASLAGHIATERGARNIAQDPASGLLYIPAATYTAGANGKFSTVPGTFRVLVVRPKW